MTFARAVRPRGRWLRLLVWCVILFGVDRSFAIFKYPGAGFFLQITLDKADRAAEHLDGTRGLPRVLVFGSSHALFGISPEALCDEAQGVEDVFNFAIGGLGARQQRMLVEALLERGTPERLILNLDWFTFSMPPDFGSVVVPRFLGRAQAKRLVPTELERLTVSGAARDELAGYAVALAPERAVLGAIRADVGEQRDAGAVYVLARKNGRWTEEARLVADDGDAGDHFGCSVALAHDTLLVGAWRNDAAGLDTGAAYVFVRKGGAWTLQAKLLPPDGAPGDAFGISVALDGDTALVGARQHNSGRPAAGAAYVFRRTAGVWRQEAKLAAGDRGLRDLFGTAVALDGDRALIGAPKKTGRALKSGAAYVFRRDSTGWIEEARLVGSDGVADARFGSAVALDGERALVGAAGRSRAYLFRREAPGWTEDARLSSVRNERLDGPVALRGATAIVGGTRSDDVRTFYAFVDRPGLGWRRQGVFSQEHPTPEQLPSSIALVDGRLLIGDPLQEESERGTLLTLPGPEVEGLPSELPFFERLPLASYAYRYRDDVLRYVQGTAEGMWTLPYRRGRHERDFGMFARFQGFEIDEYGHARGRARPETEFIRRRGEAFAVDPSAVAEIAALIGAALRRGVRVDLVHIPEHVACHAEGQRYVQFAAFMERFAGEVGVPYHDFNRPDAFPIERTELFFDTDHLNVDGALLFSRRLGVTLGLRQAE